MMRDHEAGFDVIGRLKAQPGAGRIVVLSYYGTSLVENRCRELGADAVFRRADASEFVDYVEHLAANLDTCPVCQARSIQDAVAA